MVIEDYLRGMVGVTVTDGALASILLDRGVEAGADVATVDTRTRDLCVADVYMWCATLPTTAGRVEDADGEWKHVEGGNSLSVADKRELRRMARAIYKRYGESAGASSFRLSSRGLKIWGN